jgi:protein-tyrosine phosphatase
MSNSPRIITLEGGYNFRDIGGYPTVDGSHTRHGLIYRSGGLHALTERDQTTLKELGIRTSFDLREPSELQNHGADICGEGIEVVEVPTNLDREAMIQKLTNDPDDFRMVDFYLSSFAPRAAYHAGLFQHILNRLDQPMVIHCSAGKDRTGIIIALLLRVAGVTDEVILEDYARTYELLGRYQERQLKSYMNMDMPANVIQELMGSHPATLQGLLTHLDEQWGSAEAYLKAGGATEDMFADFRARFVEANP